MPTGCVRRKSSSVQLRARTEILEQRELMLDKVFASAREQLTTIQQWSTYAQVVVKLVNDALGQLAVPEATDSC